MTTEEKGDIMSPDMRAGDWVVIKDGARPILTLAGKDAMLHLFGLDPANTEHCVAFVRECVAARKGEAA